MGIGTQRKEIDKVLDIYRERLDTIPDDLFTVTPPGGGWSYAEVYSHILQATLGSGIALERCANGNCKPTSKGPNLLGRLVLFFNRFPPVRIKVPEQTAARMPVNKMSKEEARNMLIKCRKCIDELAPRIHDASPQCKIKHPRLGMLNARQWFKFILIHAKHHIKQLDRIQKKFHIS